MSEQRIKAGQSGTLVSYPRLTNGQFVLAQPSAVSVRIGTPAVSMPSTYDSSSFDNTATTVSSAVAEGATTIPLAATVTSTRGHLYLIDQSDDGAGAFLVEAAAGASSANLYLSEPLPVALTSGNAVKCMACTYTVSAAQTDQPGNGLALWKATIGGVVYEWAQSFRIARRIPVCPLIGPRLTQAYPVIHTFRARTDLNLEELIRSAWEFRVLRALEAKGVAEEDIVSTDVLEPLVAIACLLQLVVQDPTQSPDYVQRVQEDYERTMASVLASRHWYEDPQSTNPPPRPDTEEPTPRRGAIGLTR